MSGFTITTVLNGTQYVCNNISKYELKGYMCMTKRKSLLLPVSPSIVAFFFLTQLKIIFTNSISRPRPVSLLLLFGVFTEIGGSMRSKQKVPIRACCMTELHSR